MTQPDGSAPASRGALSSKALPAWHDLTLTGGWTNGGYDSYSAG